MTTLFISDLHLQEEHPEMIDIFLTFLKNQAMKSDALYILGDFFDAWVGDDDDSPWLRPIYDGLRALSDANTPVYFIHGNRDFLVGEQFAQKSGVTLLPEEHVIDLNSIKTLLLHGDTLCTQDVEYQAFRLQARDKTYQASFLAKPLAERKQIAAQLRAQSRQHNQIKPEAIMDVTPEEVINVMQRHGVTQLIHGHTHRPAIHDVSLNNQASKRIVLDAWESKGSYLLCDNQTITLHYL